MSDIRADLTAPPLLIAVAGGSGSGRTTTKSPSSTWASVIESPRTRRANSPSPANSSSSRSTSGRAPARPATGSPACRSRWAFRVSLRR